MFGIGKKDKEEGGAVDTVTPEEAAANLERYEIDADHADKWTATLLKSLDKAVKIQAGTIVKYVESVKKRNPTATPEQLQEIINKHFRNITTGTGAGAGAAASVPGVGFFTGAAAIGADSLVFLEAAAWYILASAHLRGIDVSNEEQRRALVLLVLTGSKGSAIVDTIVGDLGQGASLSSAASLTRFSAPTLSGMNARLGKLFAKQITKRFKWAWVSKLMPLGIGAVLGSVANRKLARQVIDHARANLDPLPAITN
ncbi:hypothetical protein ACUY2E_00825 [Corynebacterium confusum]|uniref:hypothetical protein n=1 Tax=uncultured Corynebacterium sp. TaxID=159447 RepID=UPI0025CC62AE|nr:hypothetical protein [uncultured Corynebacterium sp.]